MIIPTDCLPSVYALVLDRDCPFPQNPLPFKKGTLTFDDYSYTYRVEDGEGDGVIIEASSIRGVVFDTSNSD